MNTSELTVVPVNAHSRAAVLALSLPPEQAQFAGEMPGLLEEVKDARHSKPMVIFLDEEDGFYRLDFAPGSAAEHEFGMRGLGLDGFGHPWQGRGLGTRVLTTMLADLRLRYPQRELLALSINLCNPSAAGVSEGRIP